MPLTIVAPERLPQLLTDRGHAALRLPNLEALLAGSSIAIGHGPIEQWVCAQLGITSGEDSPIAPLRLAGDTELLRLAGDADSSKARAREGYWLCADPIATTMGIDSVRIDSVVDDLALEDAHVLVSSLTEFFAVDGLRFEAPIARHWYVHSTSPQRMSTTPISRALGGSMLAHMPTGADAAGWRSRLNEAQMLLHAHPVNAGRERRGQAPVASCWWWGGGCWPEFVAPRVDAIIGAPDWAREAARENAIAIEPDAGLRPRIADSRRRLVFAEATGAAAGDWMSADRRWFEALRVESPRAQSDTIVIPWFDDTMIVEVGTASDHVKGWRRSLGWLGRLGPAPAPAASVADALQQYLQ